MDIQQFIQDFREAFGQKAALPLLFGYSDQPVAATEKIGGCFFKGLQVLPWPVRSFGASICRSQRTGIHHPHEPLPRDVGNHETMLSLRFACVEEDEGKVGGDKINGDT